MESRNVYDWPTMAEDWLPLHPDFYQFIQEDKDGKFIVLPDGTRMTVRVGESQCQE